MFVLPTRILEWREKTQPLGSAQSVVFPFLTETTTLNMCPHTLRIYLYTKVNYIFLRFYHCNMAPLRVYGFCTIVSASLAVLLAMSTDFFVAYINEIITPCQHDSEYRNGECICDNTGGVFSGTYCEQCECKHLGICSVMENSSSRWGCRCPSHQKWTSTLCDTCYATLHDAENCRGDCVQVEGIYKHYGPKCNTVCMPDASSTARRCIDVRAGGGTCNACNGHGSCSSTGACDCDANYFTTRDGEQCKLQCSDAGITCPINQGRCQSIGGQLQCVCEPGWYGRDCDQSCLAPGGNQLPCSGHGTCGYNFKEELTCACETHWIGDFCEQKCPGDVSYPTSCSGHGQCASDGDKAICECAEGWESSDCSCSALYTCSGHGTCNEDASCECFDYTKGSLEVHFDGLACERCKDHWFGEECHLYCEESMVYAPNADTDGQRIGCNGHGACQLDKDTGLDQVVCVCDGTNPDTFCATCNPNYYPITNILNVSVPHCSVTCEPGTCFNRGTCNEDYDGSNHLCNCNTITVPGTATVLDTLDPEQNCATCKRHWYPSLMSSPDRCTKYCATEGRLETGKQIVFDVSATERNYDLMGDTEAQKICVRDENASTYTPDADCSVCSGQGTCYSDGRCKCSEGTTGEFCTIQCSGTNGRKCSDHGRCVRNELELWFNPDTETFRCECTPYDPYTSETRQRLIKQNFRVTPPPAPHYYGQLCEFHCPRYNENICADRGECTTEIATNAVGEQEQCRSDLDCKDIEGGFCARRTSPWDSLMNNGKSFFSSGPNSPGYYTCATSEQCLDDIYSIKWDDFCVNMLHGWYPPSLNNAKCTYAQGGVCRDAVETFFMADYKNGQTWCETAMGVFVPSMSTQDACGKHSYADENQYNNERVPICWEYTLSTTCNAQSDCMYDETLQHIQDVDVTCANMKPPCSGFCRATGDQSCETKTYCRAKQCPDIMLENSVESLCVIEPPCSDDTNWANFCADTTGNIRNVSNINVADTFYSCHMFKNRNNPQRMEKTIPGGIRLNGMLRIFGEDVSVESLRASVVASVIPTDTTCQDIDFTQNNFCEQHLQYIAPSWFTPIVPGVDWFQDWLVACPEGPDSLWSSEAQANVRIKDVSLECVAFHRTSGVAGDDWTSSSDEKDTIAYTSVKKFTVQCPGRADVHLDQLEFAKGSAWPANPSGCTLINNVLMQRWGQTVWTPLNVQTEFTKSCLDGLEAPWIPVPAKLPTLCDLGACHPNDACILCSDPSATCDKTASVQCTAPLPFSFRDENRCGHGGHAWQRFAVPSKIYYCDWTPSENVSVQVNQNTFEGFLTSRGILTILEAAPFMTLPAHLVVANETRNITSFRTVGNSVSLSWSPSLELPAQTSETFIETLQPCNHDYNWYSFCASRPLGKTLDTFGSIGLGPKWSGDAQLLAPNVLSVKKIQFVSDVSANGLVITMQRPQDRLRVTCGTNIMEGQERLHVPGNVDECTIESVYGRTLVSSILLGNTSQILDFDIAQENHAQRRFLRLDASRNRTGLSDWSFDDRGIVEKHSFEYDNTAIQFDLNGQHDRHRLSGWLFLPDDDGETMTMRLTNEEGGIIAQVYVWAKALYLKRGDLTEYNGERICSVPTRTWWYWSIDAEHLPDNEVRRQAENHTQFHPNQTYFTQDWKITIRVDDVQWSGYTSLESGVKLHTHHKKSAAAFHVLRDSARHECHQSCLTHSECEQWSWSHEDKLCSLHAKPCHKDPHCVHGKHALHSIRSHRLSHFDIFGLAPKTTNAGGTKWQHLRAEPILDSPQCDPIPLENIHERWREPFEGLYEPFEPDATFVCNTLATVWNVMPEYTSRVCFGQTCEYRPHDLAACGDHLSSLEPSVPENCDSAKFLATNWTAYCHYISSFDPVSESIPFLGGLSVDWTQTCETSWDAYDDAVSMCPKIQSSWFRQCFDRTSVYDNYCSNECISEIESMLATTNESVGICKLREELLDIDDEIAPAPCECSLDDLIITDFCSMQDAYHDNGSILIPELYHSECSSMTGCADTLKKSMNRSEWLTWCSDFSTGNIEGVCSKTACQCAEEETPGVAGERCELTCASGISDGKELACSGTNGRCFAITPSEKLQDTVKQRASTETREGTNFTGPLVPEWLSGPTPAMDGRCQCALGSGAACSIPCDGCNNGTYGYGLASQYGICDSFNGICRSLPSFMRFNTKFDDPALKISYNTTAFESGLGTYRWQFPDRFLFEADETLFLRALQFQFDRQGVRQHTLQPVDTTSLEIRENIDTMLRVFRDLCWADTGHSFEYLDNDQEVTFAGRTLSLTEPTVLKEIEWPAWGQCTKIPMDNTFYFCFARGTMHGYDGGPLIVRSYGEIPPATSKMSFTKRDATTIYAYGGEIPYEKTTRVFDELYKITFERRKWSPNDIVFMNWKRVEPIGAMRPPPAINAPMFSFYDALFLVTSQGANHTLYSLRYATVTNRASWSRQSDWSHNAKIINVQGNTTSKEFLVFFEDGQVFSFLNETMRPTNFSGVLPTSVSEVIPGWAPATGVKLPCEVEISNHTLTIAGLPIAHFSAAPSNVKLYMEEWLTIDVNSKAGVIARVHNAIEWQVVPPTLLPALIAKTKFSQWSAALDLVSRTYMHQARWSLHRDMYIRHKMSAHTTEPVVALLNASVPPNEDLLQFFSALDPTFFENTPANVPSEFSVRWEGETFTRALVIQGTFGNAMAQYAQKIDFGKDEIVASVEWTATTFKLLLQRSNGIGRVEWSVPVPIGTFVLVMHLEEWLYDAREMFEPQYATGSGVGALLQLYGIVDQMSTFNMLVQTKAFLEYTPSHCSMTADQACPGILPYVGLPCSGRGKCSISCQCTCDVAGSVLASGTAIGNTHWSDSPFRGPGCSVTCPGYDGFDKASICNSRGVCQRDGKCTCSQGFTGEACQFECPMNEQNETCSLHGGCGTEAKVISSFHFDGDAYSNTLNAKNRHHFKNALKQFYGTCSHENFIEQSSTFGDHTKEVSTFETLKTAQTACVNINDHLDLDMTVEENRIYSVGACMGVHLKPDGQYATVVLDDVATTTITLDDDSFSCDRSECAIALSKNDDRVLSGIRVNLDSPSFQFRAKYVHGGSKGTQRFNVNDKEWALEVDWTPHHCRIDIGTDTLTSIVNVNGAMDYVLFTIRDTSVSVRVFPAILPAVVTDDVMWIAPQYDVKYIRRAVVLSGHAFNAPSVDTRNARFLMRHLDAELECDEYEECDGIIRWDNVFGDTLYSMFTTVTMLDKHDLIPVNASANYVYFEKTNKVYTGRRVVDAPCTRIERGLAKYPTVDYVEEYNIPIQNADLRSVRDEETNAVIIGNGIWTKCWTHEPNIHTKAACYEEARKSSYGFAFSEETSTCLVYTGITDPSKIKLNEYTDTTRLTLDNPCVEDAVWIT